MASGEAICATCQWHIKLEPCSSCSTGYLPDVCPNCEGEIEVIKEPVSEEEE